MLVVRGCVDFSYCHVDLSTGGSEGEGAYLFVVAEHVEFSTMGVRG